MTALGKIAAEQNLCVQSHLSENLDEIAWVRSLHLTARSIGRATTSSA